MVAQMHTSHDQGLSTSFLQTVMKEKSPNFDIGSNFWVSFFFFFFWTETGVERLVTKRLRREWHRAEVELS